MKANTETDMMGIFNNGYKQIPGNTCYSVLHDLLRNITYERILVT